MVVEQQLVDYIKKARDAGQSDSQSRVLLVKNGWTDAEVSEVLATLSQPQVINKPSPEIVPQIQSQPKIQPQPQIKPQSLMGGSLSNMPMGRSHFAIKLLIVLIIVAVLGGVGYFVAGKYINIPWNPFQPNSGTVISKMLMNLKSVKSSHTKVQGEVSVTDNNNALQGKMLVNLEGENDLSDINNPKVNLTFKIDVKIGESGVSLGSVDASIISVDKSFYFKINDIPPVVPGGGLDFSNIKGKWLKIDQDSITKLAQTQGGQINVPDISRSTNSEFVKKIQELIASENIFLVDKQLDDETIGGQNTYHYLVKITKEKLGSIVDKIITLEMQEVAKTQPENSSPLLENMARAAAKTFVDGMGDISMELFIGKNDYMLYGAKFDKTVDLSKIMGLTGADVQNNNMKIMLKLNTINSNFNKPITVQAPENAQKIEDVIIPLIKMQQITANMTSVGLLAQRLFNTNKSYYSLCSGGLLNGYLKGDGMGLVQASNDIISQGGKRPVCFASAQNYCVSTQLMGGDYLCRGPSALLGSTKCISAQTICR